MAESPGVAEGARARAVICGRRTDCGEFWRLDERAMRRFVYWANPRDDLRRRFRRHAAARSAAPSPGLATGKPL
jgi:hypothetical protein